MNDSIYRQIEKIIHFQHPELIDFSEFMSLNACGSSIPSNKGKHILLQVNTGDLSFLNKIEQHLTIAKQNFPERATTGPQITTALGRR